MSTYRAAVGPAGSTVPSGVLLLVPEKNLRTGIEDFADIYSDHTSLEQDVLTLTSAIYACDLACKRGEREEITRDIELIVPVVNRQVFKAVQEDIEMLLWTLSHDNWSITFVQADGTPESKKDWPTVSGATILFSGGVDSFVGAVELLQQRDLAHVQLASHVTHNPVTRHSQDDLASHLRSRFGPDLNRIVVRTGGRNSGGFSFPSDADREETQRTRSLMFLAIAALAARRTGLRELVVIAENGQMAIHLPLSVARIGAFSTHTAHPEFVAQAAEFFARVLDVKFDIMNPYLYSTKGEVVAKLGTADRSVLYQSVSCWRGARVPGLNHCGECVPCLVRRIALEVNGIKLAEHKRDLFAEDVPALPENDEGKRNLVELAEFAHAFSTFTEAMLTDQFPDLINPEFDQTKALSMYRRFGAEAESVLRRYAGPAALLPPSDPTPGTKRRKGAGK